MMKKDTRSEPEFITASELARRIGVSERAVKKAVDTGRIHPAFIDENGRRFFSEDMAIREWGRNTLPHKSTGSKTVDRMESAEGRPQIDATKARVLREAAQARILNFKAKTMEKELVNVGDVARMWEKHVGDAKRLFLALPAELRMLIPTLTSENITLMENRIIAIMETLSSWHPGEDS